MFPFFTDPEKMIVWKAARATLDPRPGGIFWIDMTGHDVARGEYVEIDPPRRVVFTFGWEAEGSPEPPGSTTVEVTLVPDGDGTLLRLVHSGVPEEMRAGQRGWLGPLPAGFGRGRGRRSRARTLGAGRHGGRRRSS